MAPLSHQGTASPDTLTVKEFQALRLSSSPDSPHLHSLSESTVAVGPSEAGQIIYEHAEPVNAATVAIIVVGILVLGIFATLYFYPIIKAKRGSPAEPGGAARPTSIASSRRSWPPRFLRRGGGTPDAEDADANAARPMSELLARRGLPSLALVARPASYASFFTYGKSASTPGTAGTAVNTPTGALQSPEKKAVPEKGSPERRRVDDSEARRVGE